MSSGEQREEKRPESVGFGMVCREKAVQTGRKDKSRSEDSGSIGRQFCILFEL